MEKKLLLCVGEGLGNVIQTLPLAKILKENNIPFDVLNLSNCPTHHIGFLFKEYAEVLQHVYVTTRDNYSGRIELATTKGSLRIEERLKLPCINDIQKQNIYTNERNEIDVYLDVARELGLEINDNCYNVKIKAEKAERFNFIIHNGSSLVNPEEWKRKKYPKMPDVAERLLDRGFSVGCIGHPKEYVFFGENRTRTTLEEAINLINSCDVFISNDTGTYHLAAALKKRGIVIFTATSITKNYCPNFHRSIKIIKTDLQCQPCQFTDRWTKCNEHVFNKWACRDVSVDFVVEKALEVLHYE